MTIVQAQICEYFSIFHNLSFLALIIHGLRVPVKERSRSKNELESVDSGFLSESGLSADPILPGNPGQSGRSGTRSGSGSDAGSVLLYFNALLYLFYTQVI